MARTIVDDFVAMALSEDTSDTLIQFQTVVDLYGVKYLVQVTIREQPEETEDESNP